MKISERIRYVGVNDGEKQFFEGIWHLPFGISYNQYLIIDQKIALIDTIDRGFEEEYLRKINIAIANVVRVWERYHEDYSIVITADHGGHDRTHGSEMPEDMLIPVIIKGEGFEGTLPDTTNIMDLAPTITKLLGVNPDEEWEGKSLI